MMLAARIPIPGFLVVPLLVIGAISYLLTLLDSGKSRRARKAEQQRVDDLEVKGWTRGHSGLTGSVGVIGAMWATDPFGRHSVRYYDGAQWTQHVADQGVQSVEPATHELPGGPGGWHEDPFAAGTYRYFDGRRWTDSISTGGNVSTSNPAYPAPSAGLPPPHTSAAEVSPTTPPADPFALPPATPSGG